MSIYLESTFDYFLKKAIYNIPEIEQFRYYDALKEAIKIYRDPKDYRLTSSHYTHSVYLERELPFFENPSKSIIFKPSVDLIKAAISTNVSVENIRILAQSLEYENIHIDTSNLPSHIENDCEIEKAVFNYLHDNYYILTKRESGNHVKLINITNNYKSMRECGLSVEEIVDIQLYKLAMICIIQYREYQEGSNGGKIPKHRNQLSDRARKGKNRSKKHSMFKPIYVNTKQRSQEKRGEKQTPKISEHRKIDHSFKVSRHIRNQPCGKGRKEIKQIWIEEHIRGSGVLIEKTKSVIFNKAKGK